MYIMLVFVMGIVKVGPSVVVVVLGSVATESFAC